MVARLLIRLRMISSTRPRPPSPVENRTNAYLLRAVQRRLYARNVPGEVHPGNMSASRTRTLVSPGRIFHVVSQERIHRSSLISIVHPLPLPDIPFLPAPPPSPCPSPRPRPRPPGFPLATVGYRWLSLATVGYRWVPSGTPDYRWLGTVDWLPLAAVGYRSLTPTTVGHTLYTIGYRLLPLATAVSGND